MKKLNFKPVTTVADMRRQLENFVNDNQKIVFQFIGNGGTIYNAIPLISESENAGEIKNDDNPFCTVTLARTLESLDEYTGGTLEEGGNQGK